MPLARGIPTVPVQALAEVMVCKPSAYIADRRSAIDLLSAEASRRLASLTCQRLAGRCGQRACGGGLWRLIHLVKWARQQQRKVLNSLKNETFPWGPISAAEGCTAGASWR